MSSGSPVYLAADQILNALTYADCIPVMRQAMIEHSVGTPRHLLRSFLPLGEGRTFAQMSAAISSSKYFGAKLVSVFDDPAAPGRRIHRGLVVLFDGATGAPIALADAGATTEIRTASASAAATDALGRPDARRLAILGTGRQAEAHIRALMFVRKFAEVAIWGRRFEHADALASQLSDIADAHIYADRDAENAVANADVVCTVTAAVEPIIKGDWVCPGTHVNLVGSSGPRAREADTDLVAKARYFVDCRRHVLEHGAEFLRAKSEGRIGDDHIAAEIGEVFAGAQPGRMHDADVTLYKSLGHAVQDLAAAAYLYEKQAR